MAEKTYHCFWVNPYGARREYAAYEELDPVLALVKRADDELSEVCALYVIYGVKCEFEPATYIETYRLKEEVA